MIRLLFVIQVPDASDERVVTLALRPIDSFPLRSECAERVVGMVFDDIIVDARPLRTAFRTRFDVNVRHALLLGRFYPARTKIMQSPNRG